MKNQIITIRNTQLPVVEHQGQRVVTLKMIDEVHERPEGTARKRFNEGEDYFVRNSDEARDMGITAPNGLALLTQTGYLMLVKSFTDDLAWEVQRELVSSYFRHQQPKSQAEIIAEMALLNVEQERRLNHVEGKIETVTETIENIKKGNMRAGYVGYRQVVAKSGMTDAKCRNLVNAYRVPTDTHEFMTPDGLLSRRAIVELEPFMNAFRQMMSEAEPRGTRWYHSKMGLFQAIGWEK